MNKKASLALIDRSLPESGGFAEGKAAITSLFYYVKDPDERFSCPLLTWRNRWNWPFSIRLRLLFRAALYSSWKINKLFSAGQRDNEKFDIGTKAIRFR